MLPETVGSAEIRVTDALYSKQREDVAKMRASLLACSDDPVTSTKALQNITVLRVYHQVARIIRYLETMDKIEDKLYESIDYRLDNMNIQNPTAWMTLASMQEQLQKSIIESHKLLQPYLNVEEFSLQSLMPVSSSSAVESGETAILSKSSRDKLRQSAQQVLAALNDADQEDVQQNEESSEESVDTSNTEESSEITSDTQVIAATILESLQTQEVGESDA